MSPVKTLWEDALADMPLIAILRGLTPDNADGVSDALVGAGFRIIEVPLNSPDPMASIERIAARHGKTTIVGAGTVLTPEQAQEVALAGGRLIVSPNLDEAVGAAARDKGMIWAPGVFTPTEAFRAHKLGADLLKFFPAEVLGTAGIKAVRAVLPQEARIAAVGGVTPHTLAEFRAAGAAGFGLGSALFKPGRSAADVAASAAQFAAAFRAS